MSSRVISRTAGTLYLLVIVCGIFAEFFVRSALVDRTDAATTITNIAASELLFRLGITADLVAAAAYLGVTFLLFILFRPVNELLALLSLLLGTVGSIVMAANLVNLFSPLIALGPSETGLELLQLQALMSLRLHAAGYSVSIAFFGGHLFVLGVLALHSLFVPRIVGWLLVVAGPLWVTYTVGEIVIPGTTGFLFPYVPLFSLVAEGALALWLVAGRLGNLPFDQS